MVVTPSGETWTGWVPARPTGSTGTTKHRRSSSSEPRNRLIGLLVKLAGVTGRRSVALAPAAQAELCVEVDRRRRQVVLGRCGIAVDQVVDPVLGIASLVAFGRVRGR